VRSIGLADTINPRERHAQRQETSVGKETAIAWTDHTFNLVWGCNEISDGCDNCYARELTIRYGYNGEKLPKLWGTFEDGAERRTFSEKHWQQPHNWNALAKKNGESRRVFCYSMGDLNDPHPTTVAQLPRLWETIRATPWLDWQMLTKLPGRYASMLPSDWGNGYPNVWLGTTIEHPKYIRRLDHLLKNKAVVHWISYEPALDDLATALKHYLHLMTRPWIVYGGESGNGSKNFRDHDLAWPRAMRALIDDHNANTLLNRDERLATFFYKQSAAVRTEMGTTLDGETVRKWPLDRRTSLTFGPSTSLFG
jgi:protein gp37